MVWQRKNTLGILTSDVTNYKVYIRLSESYSDLVEANGYSLPPGVGQRHIETETHFNVSLQPLLLPGRTGPYT